MSQVKNLRAMFENKGDDSSPPDRGRSPGPSGSNTPGGSYTGSPRPLSRIRSSFVAIEKDGRLGLQRTISEDGSLPRRRMSGDTDAESVSAMSDNRSVATAGDESAKPARRTFINDPIPESPRLPNDPDDSSHGLGAVTGKPSLSPDKQTDEEQSAKKMLPADPTIATAGAAKTAGAVNGKPKPEEGPSSSTGPTKSTTAGATKKVTARPSTISTKSSTKATAPSKSPAIVKTPTSATSTAAPKPTARTTTRTGSKRADAAAAAKATASTATKATASSATKKPATLKPSSSGTGFVKPKVKSPTKPVSLPPSLMAPTASSGAKGNASRPSLTAQTGNAQARSSSRASTVGASKFPKAPVSKHPRPSIGPPPKRTTQERPVTRDSNVDEGFLARMMRPTASSAQKTAEKVQLTPPRRTAGRPSTTSSRRESSVRSSSRTKTPSIHASESADDHKHHNSSIDEVAVETAIAETAEEAAEAATEVAPVAEQSATVQDSAEEPVPEIEATNSEEPALTDAVILETAEVETAEEAAELAEEAEQVHPPVEAEPETELTVSDTLAAEEVSVEEAAVETAVVETADEISAFAKDAELVQTPAEPETVEVGMSKEDEAAVETANVETAEDVAVIAEEADMIQKPNDPTEVAEDKVEHPAVEEEAPSVADVAITEPTVTEVKKTTPSSPIDSDIDSLADKLAETRIEASDDPAIDGEAKETR